MTNDLMEIEDLGPGKSKTSSIKCLSMQTNRRSPPTAGIDQNKIKKIMKKGKKRKLNA